MSDEPIGFPLLSRGALAFLVDLAAGTTSAVAPQSPRQLWGHAYPLDVHQRAHLFAAGMLAAPTGSPPALTPLGEAALLAIAQPRRLINLKLWADDETAAEASVIEGHSGVAVVLDKISDGYRVVAPVERRDVLDVIAPFLATLSDRATGLELAAHLPVRAARVLAAAIDLLGARKGISTSGVAAALSRNWSTASLTELSTVVGVVGGDLSDLDNNAVAAALSTVPWSSDTVGALAQLLVPLTGGMRVQSLTWPATGSPVVSDLTVVTGRGGVLLGIAPTVGGYVELFTLARSTVVDHIAAALALGDVVASGSAVIG